MIQADEVILKLLSDENKVSNKGIGKNKKSW
jgi:hypothetical protein